MPTNPYSVRFLRAPNWSTGPDLAFTVDSSHVGIVKCITAVYGAYSQLNPWEGWLEYAADGTKLVRGFVPQDGPTQGFGGVFVWYGSWVVEPGESVNIHQYVGVGDWHASGYLLSL